MVIGGQPYVTDWAEQQHAVWNDALSRLMLAALLVGGLLALHMVLVLMWHILPLLRGTYVPLPAWLAYPGACLPACLSSGWLALLGTKCCDPYTCIA